MSKWLMAILLALNTTTAFAQVQLQQFPFPGPALPNADGTLLNRMVNAVNKIQGTSGTTTPAVVNKNNTAGTVSTPLTGTDLQVLGANAATARIELDAFGGVPLMSVSRRNGTLASPTAILSADQLGGFNFHGASTTALVYGPAASYRAYATENWSSTAGGAKLVLSTTPNTTQTLTDAVTIGQDQSLLVASASATCLNVGPNGATGPTLTVVCNTTSAASGLSITSAASGSGVALASIGGTNEAITIKPKGAGILQVGLAAGTPAHIATAQTTAPALTSCGTGSPAITGTDTAGIVTLGTSATGCVITFNVAYTGTPYCVVSWIATPLASQSYVTSNTAITLTQTSASANKIQYICLATAGG